MMIGIIPVQIQQITLGGVLDLVNLFTIHVHPVGVFLIIVCGQKL